MKMRQKIFLCITITNKQQVKSFFIMSVTTLIYKNFCFISNLIPYVLLLLLLSLYFFFLQTRTTGLKEINDNEFLCFFSSHASYYTCYLYKTI